MQRVSAFVVACVLGSGIGAADLARAGKKKPKGKAPAEAPLKRGPLHPVLRVPVYEGAVEASDKTLRGLGLDAFDGYVVGAFFTNTPAIDVATYYIRALQRTVKKEESDGNLRYTLMIEPPSASNPLGEKVVIDQGEGGVKTDTGESFKTSIAVYRKKLAADADAPRPSKTETPPKKE
jgi:hypothetical protein